MAPPKFSTLPLQSVTERLAACLDGRRKLFPLPFHQPANRLLHYIVSRQRLDLTDVSGLVQTLCTMGLVLTARPS
jgi:hypothetical protein